MGALIEFNDDCLEIRGGQGSLAMVGLTRLQGVLQAGYSVLGPLRRASKAQKSKHNL